MVLKLTGLHIRSRSWRLSHSETIWDGDQKLFVVTSHWYSIFSWIYLAGLEGSSPSPKAWSPLEFRGETQTAHERNHIQLDLHSHSFGSWVYDTWTFPDADTVFFTNGATFFSFLFFFSLALTALLVLLAMRGMSGLSAQVCRGRHAGGVGLMMSEAMHVMSSLFTRHEFPDQPWVIIMMMVSRMETYNIRY